MFIFLYIFIKSPLPQNGPPGPDIPGALPHVGEELRQGPVGAMGKVALVTLSRTRTVTLRTVLVSDYTSK